VKRSCFIEVPSAALTIADSSFFFDMPTTVRLAEAARLEVSYDVDEDGVIRLLRLAPERAAPLESRPLGELYVEFCVVLVCDELSWAARIESMSDNEHLAFQDSLVRDGLVELVEMEGCPAALVFRTASTISVVHTLHDVSGRVVGCSVIGAELDAEE